MARFICVALAMLLGLAGTQADTYPSRPIKFLVSFPPLVKALCRAGIVGAFPHVNARPSEQLDAWLTEIETDLADNSWPSVGSQIAAFTCISPSISPWE